MIFERMCQRLQDRESEVMANGDWRVTGGWLKSGDIASGPGTPALGEHGTAEGVA